MIAIRFTLNGQAVALDCEPDRRLLDIVRETFGLTAAKPGCEIGRCGACMVWLDGAPANACLVLAAALHGRQVETYEAVAQAAASAPVRAALAECGGLQCGYCTPGLAMTLTYLHNCSPRPDTAEAAELASGNLCRCTGYGGIQRSIQRLFPRAALIHQRAPLIQEADMTQNVSGPPAQGLPPTREQMLRHLRRSNDVARRAMALGHHPFGAVLVGPDQETVLLEQCNIDTVNHAEATLARVAATNFTPEFLWGCTLYTAVEPCCMCAGTAYWANIGRVVFGMTEHQLLQETGNHAENPTMSVDSRYVFEHGQKPVELIGPVEEIVAETVALQREFWSTR